MSRGGPIAIGAAGERGTLIYARLLQELGWDLGDLLDGALDNLLFVALITEPSVRAPLARTALERRAAAFARHMSGERLHLADRALLSRSAVRADGPIGRSARRQVLGLGRRVPDRWAWKEPTTQLFLEPLAAGIADLRYLHVLRHGLDAAFSPDTAQLRSFGARYGIAYPDDPELVPERQLDFWIASTRRSLTVASERLGGRHLVSRFDDLYEHPRDELGRIVDFAGVDAGTETSRTSQERDALIGRLETLLALPTSRERYRHEDLRRFRSDQLQAVEDLGFEIRDP
jgi:hypothetical protein